MGRKKRETIEFRFYDIPQNSSVLALLGDNWIRYYGTDEKYLHFHNLMEIGFCHYGNGELILDQKRYHYEDNMFSVIPANYPHTTLSEKKDFWEYIFVDPDALVMEMYPNNPAMQREALDVINKRADLLKAEDFPEMANIIKIMIEEMRGEKSHHLEVCDHLAQVFQLHLIRLHEKLGSDSRSSMKQWNNEEIIPALEYVDDHYAENIKAGDLAKACSMSESHFRRIFETYMKMSPIEYVNLVRIQKACQILKKTNHSMDTVAAECGFPTTSTFNRNFKKYLDTSPYQWKINRDNFSSKIQNFNISALKGW